MAYPPVARLLPHSGPMVLIDRLLRWEEDRAAATLRVRANTRFVEGDTLQTPCLLEHMAQTIAASLGYEAFRDGRGLRRGMIVGCREFKAHVDGVRVGDDLLIEVERESGSEAMSRFGSRVTREADGILVAEATMTLFHGELPR
jgi:predicted hotdog family 3-hydroxylacyl-ACP dehydratase